MARNKRLGGVHHHQYNHEHLLQLHSNNHQNQVHENQLLHHNYSQAATPNSVYNWPQTQPIIDDHPPAADPPQKVLKHSDVGNLGRIVLPKKEAEMHLPELKSSNAITITTEDIATSNVWTMLYGFWPNNNSRMYLFEITGGEIVCEELPIEVCAFSIASSGKRCLLENNYVPNNNGRIEYECRTSQVVVERLSEHIETDECVNACGVDRNTCGISSDAFFEPYFVAKLCSPACYQNCPNIVDLYYHLAAAEGVFLPKMCEAQKRNPRRAMAEQLLSNGDTSVAPPPFTSHQGEDGQLGVAHSPQIAPASAFKLIFI